MKLSLIEIMFLCLITTIILEVLFAFILGVRKGKDFLNIILVNILTNPLVVSIPFYINITYGIMARNIVLGILEILTVITEGLIYQKYLIYQKINPILLAFILNLFSYLIGEVINHIIF